MTVTRRRFIEYLGLVAGSATLGGCGYLRIDPNSVFLRSDIITTPEKEKEILAKGRTGWTTDGKIRVIYVSGTAYERGYQHGALLREEVRSNLLTLWESAVDKFRSEELFAESFERMRPFIPQEYIDEMHGLAHGSKLPLSVIHGIHALPEMSEWGGKKRLKKVVKDMMDGVLGTSCSNFCVGGAATADGKMYTVRILDWGLHRISRLHDYPLILVSNPDVGVPSAVIGWVGFLGAISGINAQSITLGEMGYGDPENETMRGKPMPFLLRDVLTHTTNLPEVRSVIRDSVGTNSFVFLMSDGKTGASEMYVRDRDRFVVFEPGADVADKEKTFPGIKDVLYGGHYEEKMTALLRDNRGRITPELIMKQLIPEMAMPSNFQNVLYEPKSLKFWVTNAKDKSTRAAEQPYTFFDFGEALRSLR